MRGTLIALLLAAASATQDAPPLRIPDLKNRAIDPFGAPAPKATVFLFISIDCPVANRYAPEIRRIAGEYGKKGVRFWLVHADRKLPVEKAAAHRRDYSLPDRILMDRNHDLVKLCGATRTPEAAVFDKNRNLAYHGRIDDLYVELGRARRKATTRDLRDALDAILKGDAVAVPRTRAVGCDIPGAKR